MEGLRTVLPFAHTLQVARHVSRILSVGVFFHGLTSERGLQTTLVSRLKALSRVNTSFIEL